MIGATALIRLTGKLCATRSIVQLFPRKLDKKTNKEFKNVKDHTTHPALGIFLVVAIISRTSPPEREASSDPAITWNGRVIERKNTTAPENTKISRGPYVLQKT